MCILPMTSERSTSPLLLSSTLTVSTMSRNTSFFLYRMPFRLQPTAPVTCEQVGNSIFVAFPWCCDRALL